MMKPETRFRTKVVDPFLKSLHFCKAFSIQQKAIRGTPDKLMCIRGYFVAMEIKALGGKVTKLQQYELDAVLKAKGIAIVAAPENWEQVKRLLKRLDEGTYDHSDL
jgi:hypothetical protein